MPTSPALTGSPPATWRNPATVAAFLQKLADKIQCGTYLPGAVLRFEIAKPGQPGKTRPIAILNLEDRVVHTALKLILEPLIEAHLGDRSVIVGATRPDRGAALAADQEPIDPVLAAMLNRAAVGRGSRAPEPSQFGVGLPLSPRGEDPGAPGGEGGVVPPTRRTEGLHGVPSRDASARIRRDDGAVIPAPHTAAASVIPAPSAALRAGRSASERGAYQPEAQARDLVSKNDEGAPRAPELSRAGSGEAPAMHPLTNNYSTVTSVGVNNDQAQPTNVINPEEPDHASKEA